MANSSARKEIDVRLEYDPFEECKGPEAKWVKGIKDLKKALKPIEFSDKATLDTREWDNKKLQEEGWYEIRMGFKIFASRLKDAMDGGGKSGGGGKSRGGAKSKGGKGDDAEVDEETIDALIAEYKDLEAQVEKRLEKWLADLVSGKADSARNLKDCTAAFKEFNKAEIDVVFTVPRERAVEALTRLAKAGGKGNKGPDEAAVKEAREDLDEAIEEFREHGKTVADAISALLTAAKSTGGNKKGDADLQAFGKKVAEVAKKVDFSGVVDGAGKLGKALEDALKAIEDGKTDPQALRGQVEALKKMSGLDDLASKAAKAAAKLEKDFESVKTALK